MPKRYSNRQSRTEVRVATTRGLWPMRVEPGPSFRWGIITRRSVLNRDGTEGSTRRQEQAVRAYLKAHNMGVVAVPPYKDIASAYDGSKRPEFENALEDLRAGRIDGLAVWKLDRLVRSTSQYDRVIGVLRESGGRLLSTSEGIDTAAEGMSKAITDIVLRILVNLAQMESENTSVRTKLMHQERARQGLPHLNASAKHPNMRAYGHTVDQTEVVTEEAELIREAAKRIIAGEACFSITEDWTRRGIPTAQGKKQWRQDVLRNILMSPRMVARREHYGDVYDLGPVPPILDVETWERVCAKLEERSFQTGRKESRLLTNIAVCGHCDEPVTGGNVRGSSRPVYVCRKRPNHQHACGKLSVVGEFADMRVAEEAAKFLNDRQRVNALLRQYAKDAGLEALHAWQQELGERKFELNQAKFNPPRGTKPLPDDHYRRLLAEIEAEEEEVRRGLAVSREADLLTQALKVDWTAEEWGSRPVEWRRAILKLITERIEITPGERAKSGTFGNVFDPTRIKVKMAG
jgi:site-specific DNA recombinase